MNLRNKLMTVFALTYVLVFTGVIFYTNNLILDGYLELESNDISKQAEIGLNTLELRVNELNYITKNFATRDNTYYFILDYMRHYINDLISSTTFIENEINFMILFDNQVIFGLVKDLIFQNYEFLR